MPGAQLGATLRRLQQLFSVGTVAGLSDAQLLERYAARRDESAFEALVARHGRMVLAVCRGILEDPHDTEDAFQATFLILARKARSIWVRDSLDSWLYRVAHRVAVQANKAVARRRRHERQGVEMEVLKSTSELPGPEFRPLLHEEINRLPENYRTALVLCCLEGLTREEAAAQLQLPSGTVGSRVARGRDLLRRRLTRHGLTLTGGVLSLALTREASAAVPVAWIHATVKAAAHVGAGRATATGAVSVTAQLLTREVLKTMMLKKLVLALALLSGAGLAVWTVAIAAQTAASKPSTHVDKPATATFADKPAAATRPKSLDPYLFHAGFLAGSLRSEVPIPLYDADPEHLWNRLFATFWIRALTPSGLSRRRTSLPAEPGVDADVPPELSARLVARWRETYNHVSINRRIEGGDTIEPPLFADPESLLSDRHFTAADTVLDEFLRDHGERLIRAPLKRAMLQRDLWPVFDLLQRDSYGFNKRYTKLDEQRQQVLARKIATVMQAVALSATEVEALPDTYSQAIRSGRFATEHAYDTERPYLPAHLLDDSGDWVEINTYDPKAQFDGILSHSGLMGFEGRAWFRVFYRFPQSAGGRRALEQFLAEPDNFVRERSSGFWKGPNVPPGTEVALARMMFVIDRDGVIRPTKILEDLQIRVLRYVDGGRHADTVSGYGQNPYQYELRRSVLFRDSDGGGLVRVANDEPRYFLAVMDFSTFATTPHVSPTSAGSLIPLRELCVHCHRHENEPWRGHDNKFHDFPPGNPFGKASLASLLSARLPMPERGPSSLAQRVIDWKVRQPGFRNLAAAMAVARGMSPNGSQANPQ